MSKEDIIKEIAETGLLKTIIQNIGGTQDDDLQDLEQDIYIDLYTKDEKKLQQLHNENQLKFFLVKMVQNNIYSTTSRFYTTYKKSQKNKTPIEEIYDKY